MKNEEGRQEKEGRQEELSAARELWKGVLKEIFQKANHASHVNINIYKACVQLFTDKGTSKTLQHVQVKISLILCWIKIH